MLRISLLVLATAALWAQNVPQKGPEPPPDVDKTLRARINEFCELHKQAKFRQAEEMVAEDTKDYFYNSGKPRYVSYEIQSISYNEDFTRATAMVICEHFLPTLGFQGKTVKLLTPFNWKIENGQWMWYIDKDMLLLTPWGKMKPPQPGQAATAAPPPGAVTPPIIPSSVEAFTSMIRADKTAVTLKHGSSDQVFITNGTSGVVTIDIVKQVPGVEAKLQSPAIPSGVKDVLTVRAGQQAVSGVLEMWVQPIGPRISIHVTVEP